MEDLLRRGKNIQELIKNIWEEEMLEEKSKAFIYPIFIKRR